MRTEKVCRICRTSKVLTQFAYDHRNADGRDGRCRACDSRRVVRERRARRLAA